MTVPLDTQVAVIGGGVVGCAVAHALARRGVRSVVLEAEAGLALGASGTNSGILHTGFDSSAGALETKLILRAAQLRGELLDELGVEVWRCGARLRPRDGEQRAAVDRLEANARANGVECDRETNGTLRIPGESVTDPVAFVHALAAAAESGGATIELGTAVRGVRREGRRTIALEREGGSRLHARCVVNAAGLFADEVARMAGDEIAAVYPRKGEFLVFAPASSEPLEQILLPVPSALGKGVLVFPTLDGRIVAGPTAREREDKRDWSVEQGAAELILPRALAMHPALKRAELVGAYAGLRPAGRGANYVIEHSRALQGLIHVAAIRSTGLSASLAIGEHVAAMLDGAPGVALGAARALPVTPLPQPCGQPWWQRAALHRGLSASAAGRT